MPMLYVGAYTKPPLGRAEGIGVYRFDDETGRLDQVQTVGNIANPTFLTASQDERFIYAVCEADGGAVAAFARDENTGTLTELNRQPSGGVGPCYVSLDSTGKYALVANYGSGSVAALPINNDGTLAPLTGFDQHEGTGVNPDRQEGPHVHMFAPTPDGRFLLATDLGTDELITYALDTDSGKLTRRGSTASTPGAGPRHFAFAPDGQTAYVINELDSTLTVFAYDRDTGTLAPRQTLSALPAGYEAESWAAQVLVSPDGRFVYGSNRGDDSIVTWAVDPDSGELATADFTPTEGSWPRHFTLDPTGRWLLVVNQKSDNLTVLRHDPETGRLADTVPHTGFPSAVMLLFCRA